MLRRELAGTPDGPVDKDRLDCLVVFDLLEVDGTLKAADDQFLNSEPGFVVDTDSVRLLCCVAESVVR